MSTQELKAQIQQLLDDVPEAALQDILDYLKAVKNHDSKDYDLAHNLKTILKEDQNLLKRLAE
jgi:hypothetical protein